MNTMDKRQYNLRSKLVAAVAMLLISCIMMVSATYAWFTLSTAPEVQGITTTVGANGNLEIALSPYSGDANDVTSGMGDANLDWSAKNLTWGNLLNLSDNYVYGLDKIVLQPAQLVQATGEKLSEKPLGYATYDSTGRPQVLAGDTAIGSRYVWDATANNNAGAYVMTEGGRFEVTNKGFGVRVVGTSSNQSEWQSAFNTALSELVSGINSAKTKAQNSLNNHGSALAGIVISKVLSGGSDYSNYVGELSAIVSDLKTANADLLDAVVDAIKAVAASNKDFDPDVYNASLSLTANLSAVEAAAILVDDDNITAALTIYKNNAEKITSAETELAKCTGTVSWESIRPVLTNIMNIDGNVKVNGKTITELNAMGLASAASLLMGGVNITLGAGSGLYADFGAALSNLEARVRIPEFTYNDAPFSTDAAPMYASMVTNSEVVEDGHLSAFRSEIAKVGAYVPAGENTETTTVIDSQLGYIVDFMFRTNASGSNLMLQTTPAQRVYEDSNSTATQGAGSTMTFTVDENTLSEDATRNLLECVRVVFFSPVDNTIYGIGILDGRNAVRVGNEITASLYLNDYETTESGAIKAGPALAEDAATLCALAANTATPVSALVYLEGEYVTNKDVANGDVSLNGTLNLQFASDANLNPMDNTALKEMQGAGQYNAQLVVDNQVLRTYPVTAGTTYTGNISEYKALYDITEIKVTMGGQEVVGAWDGNNTITVSNISGDIVVDVTATLKTPESGEAQG